MKLDAAPPRRDGPRDNRFEGVGRDQRGPQSRGGAGGAWPAPQPAAGTAMASAFSKLAGLKK